jgi:hypothetical protein
MLEFVDSTIHFRLLNVNDEILHICGLLGGTFKNIIHEKRSA